MLEKEHGGHSVLPSLCIIFYGGGGGRGVNLSKLS